MAKYVVDSTVLLLMLQERFDPPQEHQLLAPTLARSEVLEALYQAVRSGQLGDTEARERLARFAGMKIRYLGDKVLRRRAWDIASSLGWDSTTKAEYVALTQLQAEALVTLDEDLRTRVVGVVDLVDFSDLG